MQSYQYVNRTHAHIYLSSTGDLPRLFNYSNSSFIYVSPLPSLHQNFFFFLANVNDSNIEERPSSNAHTEYCELIPSYCFEVCRH